MNSQYSEYSTRSFHSLINATLLQPVLSGVFLTVIPFYRSEKINSKRPAAIKFAAVHTATRWVCNVRAVNPKSALD